jgi:hypothetical protein
VFEYLKDVETSKSILFKKNMKILNYAMRRENEAKRVLIEAIDVNI